MAEIFGFIIKEYEFELQRVTYLPTNEVRYSGCVYKDERQYNIRLKNIKGKWVLHEPSYDLPPVIELDLQEQIHQQIVANENSHIRHGNIFKG